jgi:transcriptional regulator with XRE-family HTH domain
MPSSLALDPPLVAVVGLRQWRRLRNLSQVALAERLGVCAQAISGWETGRAHPHLENARRLVRVLEAPSLDALFPDLLGRRKRKRR